MEGRIGAGAAGMGFNEAGNGIVSLDEAGGGKDGNSC